VAKYGVGVFPPWVYLYDLSVNWQDPSSAPLMSPPADYLQVNFVAAYAAGILRLTSAQAYFLFHLCLALAAIVLPFIMPAVRESKATSRIVFIVVAGGPVLAMLMMWANGYDAVTVLGLVLAACSRSLWLSALGWFIATLNHPPLGVIAFAVWLPVAYLTSSHRHISRQAMRFILAAAAVIAGYVINAQLMSAWGGATSRDTWFIGQAQSTILDAYWSSMPMAIFSSIGIAWLVLLAPSIRRLRVAKVLIVEVVLITLLEPLFIQDVSRAIALSVVAAILTLAVSLERLAPPETVPGLWRSYGIAAAIVPIPLVFSGAITYTGWGGFQHLGHSLQAPPGYTLKG
jgi:hypothetical protein